MKNSKLSIVATLTILGIFSGVNASEFDEAFTNGKVSGDVTATYEQRSQDVETGNYYNNSAYSVVSAELIYKTADFHNFSLAYGLRGYRVLWEDDKNSISGYGAGKGDASSRFFNINGGEIAVTTNAYLAYDTDIFHIKAGRQELETEWMDEHHDAVSIYANPTEELEVELIWSQSRYRMWARELFYGSTMDGFMGKINSEGGGLYKVGLTYKISDSLKAKVYALSAPENYSVYGGRVSLDTKVNDISLGGFIHYMQTNEELDNEDGELLDVKAYVGIDGYKATLGYIQTGKDGGWGSAWKGGENVDPFEEGDQLYNYVAVDSRTTYIALSKSIAGLSLSGIYGLTDYRSPNNTTPEYHKSEFCVWASYNITKKLNLSAILTLNDSDEDDSYPTSDMTQVSTTLVYKF
ncbi:MAG: hypothetical protein ACJAWW_002305 [Sulfurimonas sp.]|jgi:hypothetical protein